MGLHFGHCRSATTRQTASTIHAMSNAGPSPVRNLSLSSGGSSALLLASWAHGHGQRDGYHLALYHSDSQMLVRNASISPNASTFLFDGLLPGSEYALKVSTLAGLNQASTSIHHWTGRELRVCLPRGKRWEIGFGRRGAGQIPAVLGWQRGLQAWDREFV